MARQVEADVGQLLWIGFEGTEVSREVANDLRAQRAGGVILFARNIAVDGDGLADVRAVGDLCHALRAQAGGPLPPLCAVDQEGGAVQRVRAPATVWPAMLALDDHRDDDALALARDIGGALARELRALGFDVDFAPVLDVHTNPDNSVIGQRALSTRADQAAERGVALASAMAAAGVIPCGKHFPGHGDTETDSHLQLPSVRHDLDDLRDRELVPFARAAQAGIPMVMTAHVVFEAIDPTLPATLSHKVVGELLRGQLNFTGVVVSDDLDMQAIAASFGIGDAAVAAIDAGCDVLLLCRNRDHQLEAFEAVVRAAEGNTRTRAAVAAAADRVRKLIRRHIELAPTRPPSGLADVGCSAHQAIARRLAHAE